MVAVAPVAFALGSSAVMAVGPAVTKAGAFVQEMLSRGTADVSAWPDKRFAAPVQQVAYSARQPCILTIAANDGRRIRVDFGKVIAVRTLPSSNPPQSHVEILGGAQPYRGVGIYLGDTETTNRVGAALDAMFKGCDTSAMMGFYLSQIFERSKEFGAISAIEERPMSGARGIVLLVIALAIGSGWLLLKPIHGIERQGIGHGHGGRHREEIAATVPALAEPEAKQASALYASKSSGCHGAQLEGGVGPSLAGVGSRFPLQKIERIAQYGKGRKKSVPMPSGIASSEEAALLARWLASSPT